MAVVLTRMLETYSQVVNISTNLVRSVFWYSSKTIQKWDWQAGGMFEVHDCLRFSLAVRGCGGRQIQGSKVKQAHAANVESDEVLRPEDSETSSFVAFWQIFKTNIYHLQFNGWWSIRKLFVKAITNKLISQFPRAKLILHQIYLICLWITNQGLLW